MVDQFAKIINHKICETSSSSTHKLENMREVKVRSGFTSRGYIGFGSWNHDTYTYSLAQLYLGSNPLSKIEIVSGLNFSNYAVQSWFYSDVYSYSKYNPKLYFGTIQTVANNWYYDVQNGQTNGLPNLPGNAEKSGSWPTNFISNV